MEFREGQTATNPKTGQKVVFQGGQWRSAGAGAGQPSVGAAMTANRRAEMKDSLTSLDQFDADLSHLEKQYDTHFRNQGIGAVREYLPGFISETNQDYDAAGQRLLPLVAKALGFTAKQMDTPAELARLEKYVPKASDRDQTAFNKLKNLRGMLKRQRANLEGQLGVPSAPQQRQRPKPRVINFDDLPE
jgi:hypothetical protein